MSFRHFRGFSVIVSIFFHFGGSGAPWCSTGLARLIFYCIYKGFSKFSAYRLRSRECKISRILVLFVIQGDFYGFKWFFVIFREFRDFL